MRIVVGLSGSSGVVYGIRLLEVLRTVPDVETHLIVSPAAKQTMTYETDRTLREVVDLADYSYSFRDIAAAPSSGSFRTAGMVICPCSMRTLSGVAMSSDNNLLVRAADVVLKERRRLVLVPRETPLHLGHLRLMVQATEIGAVIAPPVPAFYTKPKSIDDIVDYTVHRVLDLFDISVPEEGIRRWPSVKAEREQPISVVHDAHFGGREMEGRS